MKKRFFYLSLMCILCAIFFGCKSAPEEVAPEPEIIEPAPQSGTTGTTTTADVVSDFSEYNKNLLDEIYQLRESAIELGAKDFFPDEFLVADAYASSIEAQFDAEKATAEYSEKVKYIKDVYASFENLAKARTAQEKIEALEDKAYAQNIDIEKIADYAIVQGQYETGLSLLDAIEESVSKAESPEDLDVGFILPTSVACANAFESALTTSYVSLSNVSKNNFEIAKQNAEDIKAQISAKDDFDKAVQQKESAEVDLLSSQWEKAYYGFTNAETLMLQVFETVSEKRAIAQQAMEDAKKRAENAALFAEQADIIAPLTEEGDAE